MTYQDYRVVPVRYEGGPLDGDLNELDYAEHELEEMLGRDEPWDFTPASLGGDRDDVIERYRLELRPGGQWVYVHEGTYERPAEERNFTALFVGGPKDGETTTFLGSMRERPELAACHYPGYRLHNDGADPLAGWQMRHEAGGG
jgi:hypothetical protein